MPQLAINAIAALLVSVGLPNAIATGLATIATYGGTSRRAVLLASTSIPK